MKTDQYDLEITIAKVLRYGVLLAGAVIFVGWMIHLHWSGNPFTEFREYHPHAVIPHLRVLWQNQEWGTLLSYSGLTMLVILPLTRVMMTAILFMRQKDLWMASFAIVVMAGLLLSFALGFEI